MRFDNNCHEKFFNGRERSQGVKITNKLIGITTILIVILFVGMAMQPVATSNQNQSTEAKNLQPVQSQPLLLNKTNNPGTKVSSTNTSITNANPVNMESKLKTINNDISKSEMGLNILYSKWETHSTNEVRPELIHNITNLSKFFEFLNSIVQARRLFNIIEHLEKDRGKIELQQFANDILQHKQPKINFNTYKALANTNKSMNGTLYNIKVYGQTNNSNKSSPYVVYYSPVNGKNQVIDPDNMAIISPITVHFGWLGSLTVGQYYYLMGSYHGYNALIVDQQIVSAINNGFAAEAATEAVEDVILAAELSIISGGLSVAVGLALAALDSATLWYCQSTDINNLNTAYDSTYNNGHGGLDLLYEETKMFDGISNSFTVGAFDAHNGQWLNIAPTLPQYVNGFATLVNDFTNKYGQNNWVYVEQNPNVPTTA